MATMNNTDVPPIGRYIDPLTDFGFKRIFGSDSSKDLLIFFLNALFKGRKTICNLAYNPQENHGPAKHYRKAVFDITCTGANGETFIIEIQRADQKFFKDRALFYTASQLHEQGIKGNRHWDFELKEVYFIGIADFNFNNSQPGKWLHHVRLTEAATGCVFYNKLEFIFLELPNFDCSEDALKTDVERWLYVLRNMRKMKEIPLTLQGETFQQVFEIAEVANLKKEEYMLYQKDVLDRWTEYAVLKTAKDKAILEGMEKGAEQKSYEVVKNLILEHGFTDAQAAETTGVSLDFVKKVRRNLTSAQ
ncbi:Rpn family recombination-promoting nuclease/putative transposase [Niabella hirudinis]|uniref:Rpn family recombination-promoting nuclease/putative transposase n=1 Tax=Niabella hirudinis TaxID=1285929 RepID=UPI003EC0CA5E